jgi:hypothetical protein
VQDLVLHALMTAAIDGNLFNDDSNFDGENAHGSRIAHCVVIALSSASDCAGVSNARPPDNHRDVTIWPWKIGWATGEGFHIVLKKLGFEIEVCFRHIVCIVIDQVNVS